VERFKQLQEAKEVLCDDVQRKAYDYWRNSHITVPWKTWHSISERSQPVRKDKRKKKTQLFIFSFKILFNETYSLISHIQVKHNIKSTYRAYVIAFGQYSKNNNNNNHHFLDYLIFHSFSSIRPSDRISLYNLFFLLFCTQDEE